MKEMKKRDEVYKIDYSNPTSRYKQRGAVQTEFFDIPTREGKTVRAQRLVPVQRMPLKEQAALHKARHPKDVGRRTCESGRWLLSVTLKSQRTVWRNDDAV